MARWNSQVRGRKITKRQMTEEERRLYGLPLTGAEAAKAETEAVSEERMLSFGWDSENEWERESTPWQPAR